MKKLLGIIVLGLLLSGCSKKDRSDEFSCTYSDGSGPHYITIMNDYIKDGNWFLSIKEENNEKINAAIFEGMASEVYSTFYKRTKKYKREYRDTKQTTYLLSCNQLN